MPPKGADEGAMIERFRSSQGDISPPAGGEFLCPWRQRNQNATGDGSDEHSVLIVAFPRTPFTRDAFLIGCAKFPARKI